MFVVLLGYFKVKPVMRSPGYHQIKQDLKYVCSEVFAGPGLRPFNLTQKARVWIYQRGGPSAEEAYHQLCRAISNVNGDQFRGSSDEEIQL